MVLIKPNNLEAEMKRKGISKNDIAEATGVSCRTVFSRFSGESQWQYAECVVIRDTFFPEMDLAYLFPYSKREDEPQKEEGGV